MPRNIHWNIRRKREHEIQKNRKSLHVVKNGPHYYFPKRSPHYKAELTFGSNPKALASFSRAFAYSTSERSAYFETPTKTVALQAQYKEVSNQNYLALQWRLNEAIFAENSIQKFRIKLNENLILVTSH